MTVADGWWNVGTWEVDRERFPRGLREVADHVHRKKARFVVWFEPERVTPGTFLYTNNPAWLLGKDGEGWTLVQQLYDQAAVLFAWEQVGGADAALEILCRTYWLPLYAYVRRQGEIVVVPV